jgi:predicted amidohydrolase
LKVAAVQFKPQKDHGEAAWSTLVQLITVAGESGAELIVCPEMAVSGYLFADAKDAARIAEPKAGAGLSRLSELARRYGAHVVCGYAERVDEGGATRLYNSARVVGPDGGLLYNYRKRLLYDSDLTWAAPGDTPYPLLERRGVSLSVGICMDLNDDRFTRFLRQKKPQVVAFCTNWLDEGLDVLPYWRHRLAGAPCYFIAANTYGDELCAPHPKTRFCGGSAILGPDGRLLSRAAKEGDGVVLAELPLLSPPATDAPSGV